MIQILGGFLLGYIFSHIMMSIEAYFHMKQKSQELTAFFDKALKEDYDGLNEETKPKSSSKKA